LLGINRAGLGLVLCLCLVRNLTQDALYVSKFGAGQILLLEVGQVQMSLIERMLVDGATASTAALVVHWLGGAEGPIKHIVVGAISLNDG
jgi:hypothetical protein